MTDTHKSNPVFDNPIVKAISSYGATLMEVLGIYFFTRKLFDRKPGIVLSEQGLYDITAFKFGLIPWADISETFEQSMQASIISKQHFLTIGVVDPDKYISKETNVLKRHLLIANSKSYGCPIHFPTNELATNYKDLFNLMIQYFDKYKPRT